MTFANCAVTDVCLAIKQIPPDSLSIGIRTPAVSKIIPVVHAVVLGFTFSLSLVAQQITYYNDVPLYSSLFMCASIVCDAYLSSIVRCGPNTSPVGPYASCACLKQQNSDYHRRYQKCVQRLCLRSISYR